MMRATAFLGCVGLLVAGAMAEEPLTVRLTTDGVLLLTGADNGKETVAWVGKTVEVRLEGDRPRTGWEGGGGKVTWRRAPVGRDVTLSERSESKGLAVRML